jgi:hypothetical protein
MRGRSASRSEKTIKGSRASAPSASRRIWSGSAGHYPVRNLFRHLQSAIRTSPAHAEHIPKSHSRQREPVFFPRSPTPGTPHVLKLKRSHQYECHPHNIERDKPRCRPVRGINKNVVDYGADGPDHHREQEPPAEPSHSLKFFSVGAIHHDSAGCRADRLAFGGTGIAEKETSLTCYTLSRKMIYELTFHTQGVGWKE